MKSSQNNFPYPVLGIEDDILPIPEETNLSFKEDKDNDEYIFQYEFRYNNPDIAQLITSGKAEYACEIRCSHTLYRQLFKGKDKDFKIIIPRYIVGEKVSVTFTIIANQIIQNYSNKGFHEDYKETSFYIEPGYILGYFGAFEVYTDLTVDRFNATSDFIYFQSSDDNIEKLSQLNLFDDKIQIKLPQSEFDRFLNLRRAPVLDDIFITAYIMPALIEAIHNISVEDNQYEILGYKWAKALRKRIDIINAEEKYDLSTDAFKIAQIILTDRDNGSNPYLRMLNQVDNLQ